jgi:hypothetical protein
MAQDLVARWMTTPARSTLVFRRTKKARGGREARAVLLVLHRPWQPTAWGRRRRAGVEDGAGAVRRPEAARHRAHRGLLVAGPRASPSVCSPHCMTGCRRSWCCPGSPRCLREVYLPGRNARFRDCRWRSRVRRSCPTQRARAGNPGQPRARASLLTFCGFATAPAGDGSLRPRRPSDCTSHPCLRPDGPGVIVQNLILAISLFLLTFLQI